MGTLLQERNGRLFIPDTDLQLGAARTDREVPIAEPADQVEGFTERLLAREAQRVLLDRRLDRLAHRCGRAKEPIRGGESFERLVRALEVVVLDEQRHPPLAVLEVGEYRAR
jgi:hypothetical protein